MPAVTPESAFALAFSVAARSAAPLSAQWFGQTHQAATCDGGALASDAVGDESPARIDAVGDATYAAALYANDASFNCMRQRLADDPTGPGGYASHAWSWGIDTDDDPANGFELVVSLDAVAGGICVECTTDQHCPRFERCASQTCGPPDHDGDGAWDGDEVVDENDDGIPHYLEPRDDSGDEDLGFILQGGRGVGCHVGPMRDNAPTGALLLMLAFGLAIRRYRRN